MEDLIQRIYEGEFKTKEDLAFALKLLINSNGTQIDDIKNGIINDLDYITNKIEKDDGTYIRVSDVIDIVNRY